VLHLPHDSFIGKKEHKIINNKNKSVFFRPGVEEKDQTNAGQTM